MVDALTATVGGFLPTAQPICISQPEEDAFACLIGDWDPMHNDPRWRLEHHSEGPIVLGYHVLARLANLLRSWPPTHGLLDDLTVTTVGLNRVRFPAPLPVAAPARHEMSVVGINASPHGLLLTTSHRTSLAGQEKPTMVAEHIAWIGSAGPDSTDLPGQPVSAISDIPPASGPVEASRRHDDRFYRRLAQRRGEWVGPSPWTSVGDREGQAFEVLTAVGGQVSHPPSETAGGFVNPLHLLSLRAWFFAKVGLPVLTDATMMAFNYGVDQARWYRPVRHGEKFRDHVQLLAVDEKHPGMFLLTTRHVVEVSAEATPALVADCLTMFKVDQV